MKIISPAEVRQAGSVQLFDCLTPAAVMEKVSASNIWTLVAYFIYGKSYGVTANVGAPMFTCHTTGVPNGIFDDDYDGSQHIMGEYTGAGLGIAGSCAKSTVAAASEFLWIQTGGPNVVALHTDDSADAGDLMISSGTDGEWAGLVDTIAAGATHSTVLILGRSSRIAGVFNKAESSSYVQAAYTAMLSTYMLYGNLI
jgi:hypothetical protein